MTDTEHVHQALRELRDIVKCRCHEAYTGRGLHDPDCECDSTDAVQTVTDAIATLTEQLEAARRDAKEAEAYAAELEVELDRLRLAAKLAKSTTDEWEISRAIGDQRLEAEKAVALLAEVRRLSEIVDSPIRLAALEGGE